jgi:tetratricopeptide (TPR) repeat protein
MKSSWLCFTALLIATTAISEDRTERLSDDSIPLCFLPMYGHPHREKPDHLKAADEKFITAVTAEYTREEASDHFAAIGWDYASTGDYETAMKRFNQAWLLNPDSYKPYLGFGLLLKQQANLPEAIIHLEKALSVIDEEDGIKQELLIETAQIHSFLGVMTRTNATDRTESVEHFSRANELFSEAQSSHPESARVLSLWAKSLHREGNYEKAWERVIKARSLGHEFKPEFIDSLSRKMPDTKQNDL